MAEDLSWKKLIRYASIKIIRKLSDDIKKLLTEQVNEGVKHNLTSKVKVITKRIDELKVLEKEIVDSSEDTDEITKTFIETTELEVNIQEVLSRADEFLSQKFTVLNINDELNVQLENQVLPDLRRHLKTVKLSSIKTKRFSPEWKALTILKERYGNKQAIVSMHMEKLANLRVVSSDANIDGLRKLFNEIE